MIYNIKLGFFQYDMGIETNNFIGFEYFKRAIFDKQLYRYLGNTIFLWGMGFAFEISSALIIAAIFTYINIKKSHFFKSAFFIPNLISSAAIASLFSMFIAYPSGLFNVLLQSFNIIEEPIKFTSMPFFINVVIIYLGWWRWYGKTAITASAGMTSIDKSLYEAAKVDGATFRQIFFKITLPLIKPILTFMFLTSTIYGLQLFDIPYMITNGSGGPQNVATTVIMYTYNQGFVAGNVGYASAASTYLFFIIAIFSTIIYCIINHDEIFKKGE